MARISLVLVVATFSVLAIAEHEAAFIVPIAACIALSAFDNWWLRTAVGSLAAGLGLLELATAFSSLSPGWAAQIVTVLALSVASVAAFALRRAGASQASAAAGRRLTRSLVAIGALTLLVCVVALTAPVTSNGQRARVHAVCGSVLSERRLNGGWPDLDLARTRIDCSESRANRASFALGAGLLSLASFGWVIVTKRKIAPHQAFWNVQGLRSIPGLLRPRSRQVQRENPNNLSNPDNRDNLQGQILFLAAVIVIAASGTVSSAWSAAASHNADKHNAKFAPWMQTYESSFSTIRAGNKDLASAESTSNTLAVASACRRLRQVASQLGSSIADWPGSGSDKTKWSEFVTSYSSASAACSRESGALDNAALMTRFSKSGHLLNELRAELEYQ